MWPSWDGASSVALKSFARILRGDHCDFTAVGLDGGDQSVLSICSVDVVFWRLIVGSSNAMVGPTNR